MFTFTSNSFLGAQSVQASTQQDIENTLNEMMGNLEKINRVDTTEEQKLINRHKMIS